MKWSIYTVAAISLFLSTAWADPSVHPVTPKGVWLAQQLDSMGVESKWIAGSRIDWQSGLPNGEAEIVAGRHTHCSAFVAAAAMKLGVHILRPPEHKQKLLANAQNEWLPTEGATEGWRPLASALDAQNAANDGWLVVASYHNRHEDKPGHIAIVRPQERSEADIVAQGPEVIQAGSVNKAAISLKDGFAGHPHAWLDKEVRYFTHAIERAPN